MKVAIWSDLHIGTHANSLFWHKVALDWTDWFKSEILKRGITTTLFLGDFFDDRDEIAGNTLDVAADILNKFRDTQLVMIPGNHDCFYKDHSGVNSVKIFSGWSNIKVCNTVSSIDFGNSSATFVPWGGDLSEVRWTPYLFGHFEINSFKMNGSKVCDKGIDKEVLFKLSPQIFSGHFHQRDVRQYDKNSIMYVGNVFETNFGEANSPKGFHILDFDTGEIEFVENKLSPKHIKIFVSECLKNSGITPEQSENIKGNIIRLIVDKQIPADVIDALQAKIKSYQPAAATVEFLTNSNIIDVNDAIKSSDLSDVSVEKAINEFITFLETPNKDKITEACIDFYNKCK